MNDEMNEQAPVEPTVPPEESTASPEEPTAVPEEPKQEIKVDIGGWLKEGWELFKTDMLKFIVSMLIVAGLSIITCSILFAPMIVGFMRCVLKKSRGEDFQYGELFDGVKTQFLPAFLVMLGSMVVVMVIGLIPIIGGLLSLAANLAILPVVWYAYAEMAAAPATIKVDALVNLLKGIFAKLQDQYFMFVLWGLVFSVVSSIGAIACCVGVFFTWPFAVVAFTISYLAVFKGEEPEVVVSQET